MGTLVHKCNLCRLSSCVKNNYQVDKCPLGDEQYTARINALEVFETFGKQ